MFNKSLQSSQIIDDDIDKKIIQKIQFSIDDVVEMRKNRLSENNVYIIPVSENV